MEINAEMEARALQEALTKYPQFEVKQPRIVARPLFQGHAFMVEYGDVAAKNDPDAWEFQNAAVKAYKRMARV